MSYTSGNGALFMQPDGPGTEMVFLGCHDVGGLEEPLGDYTPFFCQDPSQPKKFVVAGESFATPEAVTIDVVEDIDSTLSELEKQNCPFYIYVNMVDCGRKDNFINWQKTYAVDARKITSRSYENVVMRDSDERSGVTHSISGAPPLVKYEKVSAIEQTLPDATGTGE